MASVALILSWISLSVSSSLTTLGFLSFENLPLPSPLLAPVLGLGLCVVESFRALLILFLGLFWRDWLSFLFLSEDATGLSGLEGFLGNSILPNTVRPFNESALASITLLLTGTGAAGLSSFFGSGFFFGASSTFSSTAFFASVVDSDFLGASFTSSFAGSGTLTSSVFTSCTGFSSTAFVSGSALFSSTGSSAVSFGFLSKSILPTTLIPCSLGPSVFLSSGAADFSAGVL